MDSYLKYATLNVVVSGLRMVWYASLGRKACRRVVVNSQKKCSFGDRGSPKVRPIILDKNEKEKGKEKGKRKKEKETEKE